ncbi:MAG: GNAT family N-acetyltransferase [Solirubrobacteraceae bacterium]
MELAREDGYTISTDRSSVDREAVWRFLRTSYWWSPSATLDQVNAVIDGSLVFSLRSATSEQAGFARVVTDRARFAWLADVFVLEQHRGKGLGVWLVETVLAQPEVSGLRILLATSDAHDLYARFGFRAVDSERIMERRAPTGSS